MIAQTHNEKRLIKALPTLFRKKACVYVLFKINVSNVIG